MEKKAGKRKSRDKHQQQKQQRKQHHPWDEVSLPGATNNTTEQPTILEVLNQVNVTATSDVEFEKSLQVKATTAADDALNKEAKYKQNTEEKGKGEETDEITVTDASIKEEIEAIWQPQNEANATEATTSDNLVSSHSTPTTTTEVLEAAAAVEPNVADNNNNLSTTTTAEGNTNPPQTPTSLSSSTASSDIFEPRGQDNVLDIESHLIETVNANDGSVGINELTPIRDELTQGTSKIETDINVRTVIEVEPAGAKIKQLLLTQSIHQHQQAEVFDGDANVIAVETEIVQQVIDENLIESAHKLVDDIEKQVLDTLSKVEEAKVELQAEAQAEVQAQTQTETADATVTVPSAVGDDLKIEHKTELPTTLLNEINHSLSQKVDEQLSEVQSILKGSTTKKHHEVQLNLSGVDGETLSVDFEKPSNELKIVNVPSPNTPLEAEERKLFIDSLPHIESDADATKLAADCKREYYQSLRKYLVPNNTDKPPIPLQTYRWEDLRRAREKGGYPWTHLYKRPLGPNEEPEIVLMLRKSQEFRFASESPKSLKKVRIDEQVLVKEAERYINDLPDDDDDDENDEAIHNEHQHKFSRDTDDEESHSLKSESISCVSDSVLAAVRPRKSNRFTKFRDLLKRHKSGRSSEDAQSLPGTSRSTSRHHSQENLAPENSEILVNGNSPAQQKTTHCYPIMQKLKSMADRQKKRLHIKRIALKKDEKIVLNDEPKILKLKHSPKSDRGEIPHFIEKQDSDDILEIVQLDESPSRKRNGREIAEQDSIVGEEKTTINTSIVEPDEIIELTDVVQKIESHTVEAAPVESVEKSKAVVVTETPPKKTPRLRREHVYEEIEQPEESATQPSDMFPMISVDALKESLHKQDNSALKDIAEANKSIPLDRMGSSEEEQVANAANTSSPNEGRHGMNLIAPISSIDSTSSDEDHNRLQLSPVAEESDACSIDGHLTEREIARVLQIVEDHELAELKSSMKKEASPAPSDKKVTFSHVEDEAEPHREDIELPEDIEQEARAAASKKWKNMR